MLIDKARNSPDTSCRGKMGAIVNLLTQTLGDWFCLSVSNGLASFSAVPSIGGRIMDLSLGQTNTFYSNPRFVGKANLPGDWSSARNYGGSKVWAAPQGWASDEEWPGPPDPVLDCGSYAWQAHLDPNVARISLESPHDEYTGITMRREVELRSSCSSLTVLHTMRNTSRRPVRWSIWQVTQVDAKKGLEIVAPATGFHQTFGDKKYEAVTFCNDQKRLYLRYSDQVAKLAIEADQGWFAAVDSGRKFLLAETFPVTPGANYPDAAPVALWISGRGTFTIHGDQVDMASSPNGCDPHVETEIMSPLTELQPGESCHLRTAWHLSAFGGKDVIAVNHCGAIAERLAVRPGSPSNLAGSYGVFWEAELVLVAYDRASRVVATFDLDKVSPLHPVRVDARIPLPQHTSRCSLLLLDNRKNQIGVLDRVDVR
jgi:hypothetical protein